MRATRPETPDFVERAPTRISAQQVVGATPEKVFEALADAPSWTQWWPGLTEARWTSAEHGGEGSTRRVKVRGLEVEERFVVWDPPRVWSFTFLAARPGFADAGVERAEIEALDDDRSRVRYTMAVELRGAARLLERVLKRRVQRGIEEGLAGLDAYLAG